MMCSETTDIIDALAGIEPGSSLDGIRARRVQARDNAQKSYLALFEPIDASEFSLTERCAVAAFVAGVHGATTVAGFYLGRLAITVDRPALVEAIKAEIERGKTSGPYGAFPAGPLSVEDKTGLIYRVSADWKAVLGTRLAAALEHAHLLVFRPRDAASSDMKALLGAGWSNTGIVTLSQLVSFLSFQVRVVAGLHVLGASLGRPASAAVNA
jgi:CMD domain protein